MTDRPAVPETPPAPASPVGKKRRRWVKILIGVGVGLVLLVALTPTLVSTGPGRRMLLGKVNAGISGTVSLDSLSLGWFSGAKVKGFALRDPSGRVVAKADQADTGLTIWGLLTGSAIDLGHTLVRGAAADVVTRADGTTNLAEALAPKGASPSAKPAGGGAANNTPPASAQPAAQKKGTIVKADLDVVVDSITASAPNSPPLQLIGTTIKGTLDTGGPMNLAINTTALNPDKSKAGVAITANGTFFSNGAMKPLAELRGTGQVAVDAFDLASLTPLVKALGVDLEITGVARGNVTLADKDGKQLLTGQWQFDNPTAKGALLQGDTLKFKQVGMSLSSTLTGESLDNVNFAINSDLASAALTGSIRMADMGSGKPLPPLTLESGVNVTEFKRQLPHLLGDVPNMMVKTSVSGTVDMSRMMMTFTADSQVSEADPATGLGDSIAIAKGSVLSWGPTPNDLRAQITYTLARLQGILAKQLPEGTVLAGNHTTVLHLTGPLAPDAGLNALRQLSFDKLTFGEDHITIKGVDLAKGELALQMKNGVIEILPTVIPAVGGGQLNPHGRVDFTTRPPTYISDKQAQPVPLVQNLAINHEIASTWLAALPLQWGGGGKGQVTQVGGQLNVQLDGASIPLDADAFKKIGRAAGVIEIKNLTTEAPFFSDLLKALGPIAKITQPDFLTIRNGSIAPVTFSFADGKILYQNLTLGTDKISMKFSGSVGLDSSLAMNMEVSIAAKGLGNLGGAKVGGVDLGGILGGGGGGGSGKNLDLAIPVMLKGTITKPEIAVSQDALNKSIQNIAPGILDDLLKKKP